MTFRDYVQVLFQEYRLIAAITVSGSVMVVLGVLLLPNAYAANSILVLTEPSYNIVFDERFTTTDEYLSREVILNTYFAVRGIAVQDATLQAVLDALDPPLPGKQHRLKYLRAHVDAQLTSNNSLIALTVMVDDPETAARVANVWADVVLARVNALFDDGLYEIEQIQIQFDDTAMARATAEAAFLFFRETDNREIMSREIERIQSDYNYYFYQQRSIVILRNEINNYRDALTARDPNSTVSIQDELVLLNFQLRVYTNLSTSDEMITLEGVPFHLTSGRTVEDMIMVLDEMLVSFDTRTEQISAQLSRLQERETTLRTTLEDLGFQIAYLGEQVDLTQNNYQLLQTKLAEKKIDRAVNQNIVRLATSAVPPVVPFGLTDRLLAMMGVGIALLIGVSVAYIRAYWGVMQDAGTN